MKKIVFVLGLVMALSLVSVASAATTADLEAQIAALMAEISALKGTTAATTVAGSYSADITKDLTLGAKGDSVTALQKMLEEGGYLEMPAGVDYGYFGGLTKAAVVKWQKDNDVSPAAGYFGKKSLAKLVELEAAAPAAGNTGALCPNGMTLASNCVSAPAAGTTPVVGLDNTDGSVSAAIGALAPTTQTIKKGDSDKPVYGIRFTASGGKVNVNRIDVHFTDRPWLIFSNITLKDASGKVLATKALTGAADVTAVTENSDYYVRLENLDLVVTPGADTNVVVTVSVPASNSFVGTSPYDATSITIPSGAIRTVNGKGIYDSASVSGTNVVTLSTSGSAADLSVTLASNSPNNGQVYIAAAGGSDTTNVPLSIYRFRSTNQDTTVSSLAFTVATDPGLGSNLGSAMKVFKLTDGTNSYYGSLSGSTVTFSISPGLVLAKDTNKDLTLSADIAASSTNFVASSTLDVSAISATDANFVTPTFGGSTMSGVTSDVAGANLTFTNKSLTVSSTVGASVAITDGSNRATMYEDSFTVNFVNGSVSPLYISTLGGDVFGTTSNPTANATTTVKATIVPVASASMGVSVTGDATTAYIIPAGATRTFNFKAIIGKKLFSSTSQTLTFTSVNYGTTAATPSGSTVTSGLPGVLDHTFVAF